MVFPLCLVNAALAAAPPPPVEGIIWHERSLTSTLDGAEQPIIVGVPASYEAGRPTPLLVALHTWSFDYRQQPADYGPEAARRGWLLVLPHFRGANLASNPRATEAGGSIAAQHDIIDAVEYMKSTYAVDTDRTYLSGASGGGHMALLMAGKYPEVWGAVCAWCPITDLTEWHAQGNRYAQHVEAVCGGGPGTSTQIDFEYLRRSPRTFITNAADTPVLLGHGDRDPTIATEQSWRTFLRLRAVRKHRTMFWSWSAGHEGLLAEGLDWAGEQRRQTASPKQLHLVTDEAKWYYWLFLEPADPMALGKASADAGEEAVNIRAEGLRRVVVSFASLDRPLAARVLCDGRPLEHVEVDEAAATVAVRLADSAEHVIELR